MPVKHPSIDSLDDIARGYGLNLTEDDLESFQGLMENVVASYHRIDELAEPSLPVSYARTPGHRPHPQDNPCGAWYWRTDIQGAQNGPLNGKTLAIKDNVCVAGVPMMNGSSIIEGYSPEIDATIVTRILDAGGRILGKAVCENLCFSGGSHTNATGPVSNPYDPAYTTGGSSCGSAALVALGEVDMAIGGDQGGSIRMPASWCGIVGHKPTYGLVPYTGIMPIEITLDHTGPMTRTVKDAARLLDVLAGPDGLDPRQQTALKPENYLQSLDLNIMGLKIGIVQEGFDWTVSEKDVDAAVEEAASAFGTLGAKTTHISLPWHRDGHHIWNSIATEGATLLMIEGGGMGTNWKGHYTTSLLDAVARGRDSRPDDLSETVKMVILLGRYMQENYHGRYYAKAQNLARELKKAYDLALSDYDILLMPTLPMKATRIPTANASREEYVNRALEMLPNACPFDVTGHPAITIPCAMSEGLPVGMMLIGRHGEDATVLRAAHAFETNVFTAPVPQRGAKVSNHAK